MKLPAGMRVLERGWLSSNNILFAGSGGNALIDSGYVTHAPQTLRLVDHALEGKRLRLLVNTHLHSDHCGGNAALHAAHGCRRLIPAGQAPIVRDWDEARLSYRATGQQCPRFGFDGLLADGDRLELGDMAWQVLAAPGHDPHSVIFHNADERLLISADVLWENGFGVIFPDLEGEGGFAEARATLERIAGLAPTLVVPGHGAPFTDVGAALERAFARLDYLQAEPQRNARYGVKVLLKFLLLERRRIPLAELASLLEAIPLVASANRRQLRLSPAQLADWAVAQLLRAGAAAVEQGMLVDGGDGAA
jgi:glyoxylase-like metal-dependent hydrolase (beta-lactamase superfamily II)